jgi:hypothetical protein
VEWDIIYYQQPDGVVPVEVFLDAIPDKVEARLLATLDAVADAPPPQFSGGGMWEAMHANMGGWYEARCTGPGREQFRLFCLLENGTPEQLSQRGLARPAITVVTGMRKSNATVFSEREYARVRELGDAYLAKTPRSFV